MVPDTILANKPHPSHVGRNRRRCFRRTRVERCDPKDMRRSPLRGFRPTRLTPFLEAATRIPPYEVLSLAAPAAYNTKHDPLINCVSRRRFAVGHRREQ